MTAECQASYILCPKKKKKKSASTTKISHISWWKRVSWCNLSILTKLRPMLSLTRGVALKDDDWYLEDVCIYSHTIKTRKTGKSIIYVTNGTKQWFRQWFMWRTGPDNNLCDGQNKAMIYVTDRTRNVRWIFRPSDIKAKNTHSNMWHPFGQDTTRHATHIQQW